MDACQTSALTFDRLAERYRDKYMALSLYDESYRAFCDLLVPGRARVLDAACGPGNVARYLMTQRPELELLGIDLAPRMVALARGAVPEAQFEVHDCRQLAQLGRRFDGIVCAFGLPYLSPAEAACFIAEAAGLLDPAGVLYLSAMEGPAEQSGWQSSSTGDQVFIHYHAEAHLRSVLASQGFAVEVCTRMSSPVGASTASNDLLFIARTAGRG